MVHSGYPSVEVVDVYSFLMTYCSRHSMTASSYYFDGPEPKFFDVVNE